MRCILDSSQQNYFQILPTQQFYENKNVMSAEDKESHILYNQFHIQSWAFEYSNVWFSFFSYIFQSFLERNAVPAPEAIYHISSWNGKNVFFNNVTKRTDTFIKIFQNTALCHKREVLCHANTKKLFSVALRCV